MFWAALLATAALGYSEQAAAASLLQDNLNSENGGATAANYNGFQNFDVAGGRVDLVNDGQGLGMRLDGTQSLGGTITTKNWISVSAGDTIDLRYQAMGDAAFNGLDRFFIGIVFENPTDVVSSMSSLGGFGNASGPNFISTSILNGEAIKGAFLDQFLTVTVASSGLFKIEIFNGGEHPFSNSSVPPNDGIIFDNFNLTVTPLPEPATWAMMTVGFFALGAGIRRRRSAGLEAPQVG